MFIYLNIRVIADLGRIISFSGTEESFPWAPGLTAEEQLTETAQVRRRMSTGEQEVHIRTS